jgi:hypothetical protein
VDYEGDLMLHGYVSCGTDDGNVDYGDGDAVRIGRGRGEVVAGEEGEMLWCVIR